MAGHVVKVSVVADTKNFSRAFKGLAKETGLSSLASAGKAAIGTLARVGAAAGAAAAAIGAKSISAAADLEQSTGAIEAVFKDAATQMKAFASQASTTVGLTKNEYQELGTLLGAQLKNAGTPMSELAGKTNELIGLGADMAAMFGGTTADAVGALSSALKGERDPIERYGVSLKQAAIDAKAAELGFQKVGGSFDQEAQAAATLALIMEQTSDAHGAFARESDTFAHQVQVLKAQFGDLGAEIGTVLLPYATAAAKYLTENFGPAVERVKAWVADMMPTLRSMAASLGPAFAQASDVFQSTILPAIRELIDWIGNKAPPAFSALTGFIQNFGPALAAGAAAAGVLVTAFQAFNKVKAILTAARVAMLALNAAMAANPIGLVVAAIAALVAGLVYAYQHSETFRNIVQGAFQAISNAASVVVAWFQGTFMPAFSGVWDAVSAAASAVWDKISAAWNTVGAPIAAGIMAIWSGVAANWDAIWNGISTVFSGVWQVITSIVQTAIGVITGIIQLFTALIQGDWSGAWEAIKSIAAAVWNGIKGVISGAVNIVQGYISTALAVIQGVWNGAWSAIGNVLSSAWNGIKTAVTSGVSNVVSTVRSIPSKALSALGNVGSTLMSAGRSLIQGFIDGIKNMFGSVQSTLGDLTSKLTSWKGPEDLDKRLLTPAGRYVIEGFIKGLESRYNAVRDSLQGLTGMVENTPVPALATPALGVSEAAVTHPSGAGGLTQVVINIPPLTPTPEVGRIVATALEDYHARNGRARGVQFA